MFENKVLYDFADCPTSQNILYATQPEAKSCPRGEIRLIQDFRTGLIHNDRFDQSLINYNESYQNEQGISPQFRKHLESVANLVEEHIGKDQIVEIGCGKGFFLEFLSNKGFNIRGYDTTYEGSNAQIEKRYVETSDKLNVKGII